MKNIAISSGHGKHVSGAVGIINEVTEARRVVSAVVRYLKQAGVSVAEFHDDTSKTQSQNLNTIVNYHNSQNRDLDVSVHFNAFNGRAIGTEVLYYSEKTLSAKVSKAISDASGLVNRGAKIRQDLAFLNRTVKPAILIEVCFVDSQNDVALYRANFDNICKAIASSISATVIPAAATHDSINARQNFSTMLVNVNGRTTGIQSILNEGVNYPNLRQLMAVLQYRVSYNADSKEVMLKKNTETEKMIVNGNYVPVERILVDGSNYVKLRELEKFGFEVDFDEVCRTVIINSNA